MFPKLPTKGESACVIGLEHHVGNAAWCSGTNEKLHPPVDVSIWTRYSNYVTRAFTTTAREIITGKKKKQKANKHIQKTHQWWSPHKLMIIEYMIINGEDHDILIFFFPLMQTSNLWLWQILYHKNLNTKFQVYFQHRVIKCRINYTFNPYSLTQISLSSLLFQFKQFGPIH